MRAAEANLPPEREDIQDHLSRVAIGLADAVEDLHEISGGSTQRSSPRGGLGPALKALAHRSPIPVHAEIDLAHRRQWSQPEDGESEAEMHARFADAAELLRRLQADLVTDFVSARLDAVIPQWSRTALAQTETEVETRRRRGQARTRIDVEYLDEAYDDEERSRLVAFCREGVSYLTTPVERARSSRLISSRARRIVTSEATLRLFLTP